MDLGIAKISGITRRADNSLWTSARHLISPVGVIGGDGTVVPDEEIEIYTDGTTAAFSVDLPCVIGAATLYSWTLPSGRVVPITVNAGEVTTLDIKLKSDGVIIQIVAGESGGGGNASGPAGGVLSGSYPNPGFAVNMAEQSELDSAISSLQISIGLKENAANKSADGTFSANSDTLFPTQKAAKTYADAKKSEAIATLRGGVPTAGDDLNKLYQLIIAINAIIGGTTADGDALVNTVAELLAVFSTYPEGVDVITALNAKVNSADVVNALTQTAAGKVLDARQGKVLKDAIDAINSAIAALTTDQIAEGAANKYFTESRVRNAVLTGISFATNSAITATDSILSAFGKLQTQITALITGKADKSKRRTETTTTGAIAATDNQNFIVCSNSSATTLSVPSGLSNGLLTDEVFAVGIIAGSGAVTPSAGSGVTIANVNSHTKIKANGSGALVATGANAYRLVGETE